jgi:RNA-binding protein
MLTSKKKQQLKAQAHKLKPVVLIGNQGLTPAVMKELERALNDHQLIKLRVASDDRVLRREMINIICTTLQAELVQIIGAVGVIYRPNE